MIHIFCIRSSLLNCKIHNKYTTAITSVCILHLCPNRHFLTFKTCNKRIHL